MAEHWQGLVDHRGRRIEKKLLTTELAGPTISGVRSPLTGYPGDGLNPVRLGRILREADAGNPLRQLELAETVEERDPHILGIIGTRKRSVSQLEITVEDGGSSAAEKAQGELVRDWLKRDELTGELFDMLDAVHKGYSFTEILWDTSEGEWRPTRLEWRDPRWFEFERHDLRTPLLIGEGGERVPLPAGKFVFAPMAAKSGIWTRGGLSRVLAWVWMFKAFTNRDWAILTQTHGQPIRVGKHGQGATPEDKAALFRAVANVAGDMAAIIPASMEIEFIESKSLGTSADLYEKRVTHLNLEASKAVLGQTTTTDAVSGGHAVSQEHRQVQEDIERSDAKQLAAFINRDLVRPWIDLQFGPQQSYPRVQIGRPEEKDIDVVVRTVKAFGLPIKRSEAYELAGISEPEEGDEVLETAEPEEPAPGTKPNPGKEARQAEEIDPVASMDQLAADAELGAAAAMDALLEMVGAVVADPTIGTLEDLRTRLLDLAPTLSTRSLALALRQARVVARLTGRAEIADG